jgi:hypothetical protein
MRHRHRIRSRLTYSNVVATLALVIAVGGGAAYAANTISSEDIINGEVKTADVGNNQIRSADVRDDTLSQGGLTAPDIATDAIGTDELAAEAVTPAELAVGATFTSARLNDVSSFDCTGLPDGWYDEDPGFANEVGYYRDPFGFVHLQGRAIKCGNNDVEVFRLPAGYRTDKYQLLLGTKAGSPVAIGVYNGVVTVNAAFGDGTVIGLDGISFRCSPAGADGCP